MAVLTVPAQFPTIQAAINAANPGDTILIAAGVYNESVTIPAGKDRLRIEGAGPTQTILDGGNTLEFGILSAGSPMVTVTSLAVRHYRTDGIRAGAIANRWDSLLLQSNGTTGIRVINDVPLNLIGNVIARCNGADGIVAGNQTYVLVSQAIQNGQNGIVATGSNNLIEDNVAAFNQNRGIVVAATRNLVLANRVRCNGSGICPTRGGGILVLGSRHLLFGNEVIQNGGCGIELLVTERVRVHQNVVTNNLRGICVGGGTRNSLTANQVRRNAFEGIRVIGDSTENLTGDNAVRGNGGAGIAHGASTTENVIRGNGALQNRPDLLDQTGIPVANIYAANTCQTASPGFLCNPNLNVLRVPDQFPTIQDAVNAASPGQVILVDAGVYSEQVSIPSGLDRILIQGAGPGASILEGNAQLFTAFRIVDASMVTIRGFTIQNYLVNGIFVQSDSNWLDNIEFLGINNNAPVRLFSAAENLLTRLDIHDSTAIGIEVAEFSSNNWLVDNTIRNVFEGVRVFDLAVQNLLWRNDVQFVTENAFNILGAENVLKENTAGFAGISGINLNNVRRTLLLANTAVGNNERGVEVRTSPLTFIIGNQITQNQDDGIRINNSPNSFIVGNFVRRDEEDGIAVQSPNVNIVGDENDVRLNDDSGLRVQAAPGNSFRRNVLCENGPPDLLAAAGNEYDLNTCDTSNPAGLCDFPCA